MYSTAYMVRTRLNRKFDTKFSVQVKNSALQIKWEGQPSLLDVSLVIRDFNQDKIYQKFGQVNGRSVKVEENIEIHMTAAELRK